MSLAPGDLVEVFNGHYKTGDVQFSVILKYNSTLTQNRLVLSVRQDDGSYVNTPSDEETFLPAGLNETEIDGPRPLIHRPEEALHRVAKPADRAGPSPARQRNFRWVCPYHMQ